MRGENHTGEPILCHHLHQGSQAGTITARLWMLKVTVQNTAYQNCSVVHEPCPQLTVFIQAETDPFQGDLDKP